MIKTALGTLLGMVLFTFVMYISQRARLFTLRLIRSIGRPCFQHWQYVLIFIGIILLEISIYFRFERRDAILLSIGYLILVILLLLQFRRSDRLRLDSWVTIHLLQSHRGDVLLYELFESHEGWQQFRQGTAVQSEYVAHKGRFSLRKERPADPNGVYRMLSRRAGLGLLFSGWIYRPTEGGQGGLGDRLAVEDSDFNGYGFVVSHGENSWAAIERRDAGIARGPERLAHQDFQPPTDAWYQFEFYLKVGGEFDLCLNDASGERLVNINAEDQRYNSFDRVTIHGGFNYYVDELKVEVL